MCMIVDCRSGIGSWPGKFGGVTIRGRSECYAGNGDLVETGLYLRGGLGPLHARSRLR
jgi:hypothetical protein